MTPTVNTGLLATLRVRWRSLKAAAPVCCISDKPARFRGKLIGDALR